MKIEVNKVTQEDLLKAAVKHVFGVESKMPLWKWYDSGHTPSRTQIFSIYVTDMPYSVAMQMRTHDKNGALFLVEPGRPDTGTERLKDWNGDNYRDQPRNVFILCNAQHLIDWSHRRMCKKAEDKTREFFGALKKEIAKVDVDLADNLVPMCFYRGGSCHEPKPCVK